MKTGIPLLKKTLNRNTVPSLLLVILLILAGVILLVNYNSSAAFLQLTTLQIKQPVFAFVRNFHSLAALFITGFTLFRIFIPKKDGNIIPDSKKTCSILVIILAGAMLQSILGVLLKADQASAHWYNFLTGKDLSIGSAPVPFLRSILALHITAALIMLTYFLNYLLAYEKPGFLKISIFIFFILLLSAFISAPITPAYEPALYKPFFLAPFLYLKVHFQWNSLLLSALLVLSVAAMLFFMYKSRNSAFLKSISAAFLVLWFTISALIFSGIFPEDPEMKFVFRSNMNRMFAVTSPFQKNDLRKPLQLIRDQPESCLLCHDGMDGLSLSHSRSNAGCFSCHRGNPFSSDAETAHRGMEKVPGNLQNAALSCGTAGCHDAIIHRVKGSMMAGLQGLISVDKYAFGESHTLNGTQTVHDIRFSPAGIHLRNLCIGCHIGAEKTFTGPAGWFERGGGCNACHLTYQPEAVADLKKAETTRDILPLHHPKIDINVTNDKCMSCHSRSGRISTSYEGWHETMLKTIPKGQDSVYKKLPDDRIFQYIQPDVHHKSGMLCIDCHPSSEIMGDGTFYFHKEEAVKIRCNDCHLAEKPAKTVTFDKTDKETQMIAWLRQYNIAGLNMVSTQKASVPLVNTRVENNEVFVLSKADNRVLKAGKQNKACSGNKVHQRLDCETCHTAWAAQCLGCHNGYEKQEKVFDMFDQKYRKGGWSEYAGESLPELPVLGVNDSDSGHSVITTFVPGMIMTIDLSPFVKNTAQLFHRLYAPSAAHTIRKESRSCASCHNDPLALGYGRGDLIFNSSYQWQFEPKYANNPNDNLPEDAWIGFLKERTGFVSTRYNYRPFNIAEQKRILRVGTCLTCHKENSDVAELMLSNFDEALKKKTKRCIEPVW